MIVAHNTLYSNTDDISVGNKTPIVAVGMQFKWNRRNCIVIRTYKNCFVYQYLNPALIEEHISEMRMTYVYWKQHMMTKKRVQYTINKHLK